MKFKLALVALFLCFLTAGFVPPQTARGEITPNSFAINGSDSVGGGGQYTPTGGTGPYTWKISCGVIDGDGKVTGTAGCCGSGKITVSDATGATASMGVRFSGGQWIEVGNYTGKCTVAGQGDGCQDHWAYDTLKNVRYCSNSVGWNYTTCEKISGKTKSVTTWGKVVVDGNWRWGTSSYFPWHSFTDAKGPLAECGCTADGISRPFAWRNRVYEWRCSDEVNCVDQDGDGYYAKAADCASGSDCNDADSAIHPGAAEVCDGKDNNCDGNKDEGLGTDADGDGHFAPGSCKQPADDSDDGDPSVYPGAPEICDGQDNNGDGATDEGCCEISIDLNRYSYTLDVGAGGEVIIGGGISEASGKPVKWTLTVAGQTFQGDGGSVHVKWNGLDTSGKSETQTYAATLHAETTDGGCSEEVSFDITVTKSENCKLRVTVGSSANVASGELTDSLALFSTSGSGPALDLSLHYGSLDGYDGPLGLGWSHSFEVFITENVLGEVVLHEGDGGRKLYTPLGAGYLSQPGDTSTFTKNADGSFLLTRKERHTASAVMARLPPSPTATATHSPSPTPAACCRPSPTPPGVRPSSATTQAASSSPSPTPPATPTASPSARASPPSPSPTGPSGATPTRQAPS